MTVRYPLSLYDVFSGSGYVQDGIRDMIREQVYFVYVEDSSIGPSHESRFEDSDTLFDGRGKIQPTQDHFLSCIQGQFRDTHPSRSWPVPLTRQESHEVTLSWGSHEYGHRTCDLDFREETGECPHSRGFGRPFFSTNQHPSDAGIDGVEYQRQLH